MNEKTEIKTVSLNIKQTHQYGCVISKTTHISTIISIILLHGMFYLMPYSRLFDIQNLIRFCFRIHNQHAKKKQTVCFSHIRKTASPISSEFVFQSYICDTCQYLHVHQATVEETRYYQLVALVTSISGARRLLSDGEESALRVLCLIDNFVLAYHQLEIQHSYQDIFRLLFKIGWIKFQGQQRLLSSVLCCQYRCWVGDSIQVAQKRARHLTFLIFKELLR